MRKALLLGVIIAIAAGFFVYDTHKKTQIPVAMALCVDTVKERMKSPSTFKFIEATAKESVSAPIIIVTYDAQNSFGATTRGEATCEYETFFTTESSSLRKVIAVNRSVFDVADLRSITFSDGTVIPSDDLPINLTDLKESRLMPTGIITAIAEGEEGSGTYFYRYPEESFTYRPKSLMQSVIDRVTR